MLFLYYYQTNAALVSISDLFQKHRKTKNLNYSKLLTISVCRSMCGWKKWPLWVYKNSFSSYAICCGDCFGVCVCLIVSNCLESVYSHFLLSVVLKNTRRCKLILNLFLIYLLIWHKASDSCKCSQIRNTHVNILLSSKVKSVCHFATQCLMGAEPHCAEINHICLSTHTQVSVTLCASAQRPLEPFTRQIPHKPKLHLWTSTICVFVCECIYVKVILWCDLNSRLYGPLEPFLTYCLKSLCSRMFQISSTSDINTTPSFKQRLTITFKPL